MKTFELIAKTFQGLEEVLAKELTELGADDIQIGRRMVSFTGDKRMMYRANFCLRTAVRILKPIKHFKANTADEVYENIKSIAWENYLDNTKSFAVDAVVFSNEFRHSKFVAYKVKDAIVDYFRDKTGERPSVRINNPDVLLNIHIAEDRCTLSLDSSGESLHRRGYRQEAVEAPLNEVLAAGMILMTGWKGECDLIDPMCGSGTFIIEALMLLTDRAPGLVRRFGFNGWQGHDHELWMNIKAEAAERHQTALQQPLPKFYAFDADWEAVKATKQNIIAAGFEHLLDQIQIEERTLADWPDFQAEGKKAFIVTNPPYGERLGDKASNRALYLGLSALLQKHFPNQKAAVIAAQVEQADVLAFNDPQILRLMNGKLPIYVRFGTIKPATVARPFLADWQPQQFEPIEGAEDFTNRLQKNMQILKKLAVKDNVY